MTHTNATTKQKAKTPLRLVAFDAARYLTDDDAIAEYITAIAETNDPDLMRDALGDVARANARLA